MKSDSSSSSSGTGSPLGLLQSLLGSIRPPEWAVDELQNRVVLFLNHVLMQEPQAQQRLRRQQGKPVRVRWGDFHLTLAATPAGLLERPAGDRQPDVQLAAEVAWLVDNVRWDVEDDLARLVGDAVAHTLVGGARSAASALKAFIGRRGSGSDGHAA